MIGRCDDAALPTRDGNRRTRTRSLGANRWTVKAPEKFRITLLGTTADIIARGNAGAKVDHYLGQLVVGIDLPHSVFDPWHLSVTIAEAPELLGPVSMHAVARQHKYVQVVCNHCGRQAVHDAQRLSDICRRNFVPTDLRDLEKCMRCDTRTGGCGKVGATLRPGDGNPSG